MCVEPSCSHKIDYNPIWITFRNRSSVSQSVVHEIDKVPVVLVCTVHTPTDGTALVLVLYLPGNVGSVRTGTYLLYTSK